MKDDCYTNVPRILTGSGPRSKRGVIKDGTSGYCPKPEDYLSNTPSIEITWNPPEQERPVVCVGTIGHAHVPAALFETPMPLWINRVPPVQRGVMTGGGPHVKVSVMQILLDLPKSLGGGIHRRLFDSPFLFPTGSLRGVARMVNDMVHGTVLEYGGEGGLLVAGQAVWCMTWGTYNVAAQAKMVMPSKGYIQEVLLWVMNDYVGPRPIQEKREETYLPQRRLTPPYSFDPGPWALRWKIKDYNRGPIESYSGFYSWGDDHPVGFGGHTENDTNKNCQTSLGFIRARGSIDRLQHSIKEIECFKERLVPKADIYGLFTPVLPYAGSIFMLDEDGKQIASDPNDPIDYARAVQNGYVGTFKEWQWSELDK